MTIAEALQQIEAYQRRFKRISPTGEHLLMAQLAAFPIALTVHLLYQLWVNFKHLSSHKEGISVLAVNDCILSNLLVPTGKSIYEMDTVVREQLKQQFKTAHTAETVKEVVSFLYHYAKQQSPGNGWKNYNDAQQQAAIMEMDPALAARNALHALATELDNVDPAAGSMQKGIGISNMINSLARDSKTFSNVIGNALTDDKVSTGEKTSGNKTLVITDKKIAHAAHVKLQDLPYAISERLKPLFENKIKQAKAQQSAESNGVVYALMVGVGDYLDPALKSSETAQDVERFKNCLIDKGLFTIQHCTVLLNKAATKKAIQDNLLRLLSSEAKPADTVLVFLCGQGQYTDSRFLLRDFDQTVEYVSQEENYIEDAEFSRWLQQGTQTNVVLIMDSCCSSRQWMGYNTKHIALFSCWPGSTSYEKKGMGGYFTTALVNAISRYPNLSYRQLLKDVTQHLRTLSGPTQGDLQIPFFQVDPLSWDQQFLFNKVVDTSILYLQRLMIEAGYKIVADGVPGPASSSLLQQIRKEVAGDENESDEALLQKLIVMKGASPWKMLGVGFGKPVLPPEVQNLFRINSTLFDFDYHMVDLAELDQQNKIKSSGNLAMPLNPYLFDCQVVLIAVSAESMFDQRLADKLEKYAHVAFALYKKVIILRTGHKPLTLTRFLNQFPSWPVNGIDTTSEAGINSFRDSFTALAKDLQRFLPAAPFEPENSIEQKIIAARRSGILDLSRLNLASLPPEMFNLKGLKELNLSGNQLRDLPETIAAFKALQVLNISNNAFLYNLPGVIYQLRNLRKLDISNNASLNSQQTFSAAKLEKLEELDISHTGARILDPIWLSQPLRVLRYEGNPLINLPPELMDQPVEMITLRSYFQQNEATLPPEKFAVVEITPGASSKKSMPEFYSVVDHINTTAQLFVTLLSHFTPNTLFFINDPGGQLRSQLGEYDDRVFNTGAFFKALHLSVNVVVNMHNINLPELWTDLVNDRAVNFAAVRNHQQGEVQQFIEDFYLLLRRRNTTFKQVLQSLDQQAPVSKSASAAVSTGLFDYYFNLQQLNDLKWPLDSRDETSSQGNPSRTQKKPIPPTEPQSNKTKDAHATTKKTVARKTPKMK